MRTFYFLVAIYAVILLLGCSKKKPSDCNYQYTAGTINGISGPDSIRVGEQNELTLDVAAPGLCTSDINVSLSRNNDTSYYLDARVQYSTGANSNCNCSVADHHYVRVYFTSPVAGTVYLSSAPGIGPSTGHSVKVY